MTNWLDKIKNNLRNTKAKLKNAFSKVQLYSLKITGIAVEAVQR